MNDPMHRRIVLGSIFCYLGLLLVGPSMAQTLFTEVIKLPGSRTIAFGDYDNDGWPDLFLGIGPQANLWHNEGDGRSVDPLFLDPGAGDWSGSPLMDVASEGGLIGTLGVADEEADTRVPQPSIPGAAAGKVLRLDGIGDYVKVSVDVSEANYTVSLWFRTTHDNGGLFSVTDGTLGANGNDRHIYLLDGKARP